MPTLSNAAGDHAEWRTCAGCDTLAPLTPDTDRCDACRLPARQTVRRLRAEHFTPADVLDIIYAGSGFAAAVADVAHHQIGDPGYWDCYGSPPDELARLRDALNGMQRAIHEARAGLAAVERRVRRRATRQSQHRRPA